MTIQSVPMRPRKAREGRKAGAQVLLRGALPGGARPALRTEAKAVSEAAREAAALRAGLSVKRAMTGGGARDKLVLLVDPQAQVVARSLLSALAQAPAVEQAAGVSAGELRAILERLQAMGGLHASATQLSSDVRDSRLLMGEVMRRLRTEVGDAARAALAAGTLSPEAGERLRTALAAVRAAEEKLSKRRRALGEETAREKRATEAALLDAERREAMLRTVLDLREERTVAPERIEEAIETYEQLSGTGERRDRGRG